MNHNLLRELPSVDRLLQNQASLPLVAAFSRELVVEAFRGVLEETRQSMLDGEVQTAPGEGELLSSALRMLESWTMPTLRSIVNATGVIIHTNLGRAPLSDSTLQAVSEIGAGYSTLEFDLLTGKRGSRSIHAEELLSRITGAEAALVVNNNAAAVLLALTALAGSSHEYPLGRGCIISRGQLVEIGGGFRMPDVMAQSGARLIEVGTTNRTHLHDYENAIDDSSALIMRVHRSNFDIIGFTTEPSAPELVATAHRQELLFVDDIGSGALFDTAEYGLSPEPMIRDSLDAGADLVLFSGDKLLGGPQAGIIVGSESVISRLKRHPLARAVRPDKLCLAALSATLLHYFKSEALSEVPVWRMISMPVDEIDVRASRWAQEFNAVGLSSAVVNGQSVVGGGSLPGESLPTRLVSISIESAEIAARRLREHKRPVIVRREDNRLLIDPRTVLDRDETDLLSAVRQLVAP